MKYEEYIEAIAPFEDFKNRANNFSDDKFKSELMEAYDKGLREIGRKILIENNITPNKLISQKCTPMTFEPISARIDVNNEIIFLKLIINILHIVEVILFLITFLLILVEVLKLFIIL